MYSDKGQCSNKEDVIKKQKERPTVLHSAPKSFQMGNVMHTLAMDYASQCLYLVLIISLPPILIASVIGIALSLVQAVTQLQEQTLVFGIKLLAVVGTLFVLGGWMSSEILRFAGEIFNRFYLLT